MALNTISLRSSLSSYLQLVHNRTDASTATIQHHAEMIQKVDGVVEAVQTKQDSITSSKVLSDEGKSQAVAALATATAPKLKFLERVVASLEDEKRQTEATLYTIKPPSTLGSDPLLKYLAGKEIRDRYRGLTQQEKDIAFLKASEADLDGDPDEAQTQANRDARLWAVLQTPGGPEITSEVRRRALEERAKRLHPETVATLHQVTLLHDSLSGLRDSLVNWLRGLGGDTMKIFDELGGAEPPESMPQRAARMVAA